MKTNTKVKLSDVQAVYGGPEGDLWELIMGEQIHIGGFTSSVDLAAKAGIGKGMRGVDLCCCNGAGMRFLCRFREVAEMTGVDATPKVIQRGRDRCRAAGLADRIEFVEADVTRSGLPDACVDFVWGEDAWCYVVDKPRLIREAARIAKPGGVIAFTDWIEGRLPMTDAEAERYLAFMKFPSVEDLPGYRRLLEAVGCEVVHAHDTGRFAPCMDLYLNMVEMQFTYDALRIVGFDPRGLDAVAGEMRFVRQLARESKVAQGLFVARKR